MSNLAEMTSQGSDLTEPELEHLQSLAAWWDLLADVSFADLLLFAPTPEPGRFIIAAQVRPSTSQTIYPDDQVARVVDEVERPLVARAFRLGRIVEGEIGLTGSGNRRARVWCVPIKYQGRQIGVMSREAAPDFDKMRRPGELERTYMEVFQRFARMIAGGLFPFRHQDFDPEELPRLGDGALVVDEQARIRYASPNALSTLHRIRVQGNVVGRRLSELGLSQPIVRSAMRSHVPANTEIERDAITVQLVAVPLTDPVGPPGALVLMRDVTELRRRDRLLISKDATIREIHHRVKNNLQTISSLLRLQGRRLDSPEAKHAIDESVRRIRAISLVHETLAHEAGEAVSLADVADQLIRMVQEGLMSRERPIRFVETGDVGLVPSIIVTPLAVVLNELLQNVVDHAFPRERPLDEEGFVGTVEISLSGSADDGIEMRIIDDGAGLPEGFNLETVTGLGTSIVHTLVTSELQGSIELGPGPEGVGTVAVVRVPGQHTTD